MSIQVAHTKRVVTDLGRKNGFIEAETEKYVVWIALPTPESVDLLVVELQQLRERLWGARKT